MYVLLSFFSREQTKGWRQQSAVAREESVYMNAVSEKW